VRGLEFRLYYPKPRSSESVAGKLYGKNRLTFRPHFYFGETNQEIDFCLFLNGLPIVALELKHEKNQNVHDAVAQFVARDHARGGQRGRCKFNCFMLVCCCYATGTAP